MPLAEIDAKVWSKTAGQLAVGESLADFDAGGVVGSQRDAFAVASWATAHVVAHQRQEADVERELHQDTEVAGLSPTERHCDRHLRPRRRGRKGSIHVCTPLSTVGSVTGAGNTPASGNGFAIAPSVTPCATYRFVMVWSLPTTSSKLMVAAEATTGSAAQSMCSGMGQQ
jgi:hypothetical protein